MMDNVCMKSVLALTGFSLIAVLCSVAGADGGDYLSPTALVVDEKAGKLYVAEFTANQIASVDLGTEKVIGITPLDGPPSGMVLGADGTELYVTGALPEGRVYVIDTVSGAVSRSFAAGHTPMAPVLSPNGKRLYVCNRFDNDVSIHDAASGELLGRVATLREPVAAALSPNGRHLFVANQIPDGQANVDYVAAGVTVIDTKTMTVATQIMLPNGSMGLRDICISPDGKHAYVTHILARFHLPTTQLDRGWMNTNALSVIDVKNRSLIDTVLLDEVDRGAANPWAVRCTADGKYVVVTHGGTHELSVIDRAALHKKIKRAKSRGTNSGEPSPYADTPNDLSFLQDIRRRLPLTGNGPRALVLLGDTAYAAEYFSDSLSRISLDGEGAQVAHAIALGPEQPVSVVRWGEQLFHDAEHCFQNWQSCTTCHPGEGRPDGLNWDLLLDGIGNPKNTKSLLLAHRTPPTTSLGIRASAEVSVRSGLKFIEFTIRPDEEASAIDEYLKALTPVDSPHLVKGALSESASRGEMVFDEVGCARCHTSPLYTNLKQYDVGTGRGREENARYDTPTLVELWRTAPYLHDGRATTLRAMLVSPDSDDQHSAMVSDLPEEGLSDLIEFVLSL